MKNVPIDFYEAREIREQVDKVLRGLGNPEPPLDLREVRELLDLDRQFYSSTNSNALREMVSRVKVGAKQLARRPALIKDIVRKAGLHALWLPDRKRILIDEDIPDLKKRWAEAHEVSHSIFPWHAHFLFGDNRETLRSSCHEKLEHEANFGSGQLLFLRGRFVEEAQDLPHTLKSVRSLNKAFGNTLTTTLWRLVEEAHRGEPIFGIVSAHPKHHGNGFDPTDPCRYFIESPAFRERFGNVTEVEAFRGIEGYASWSKGGPLGEGDVEFVGRDGERHRFHLETFYNRYEALTLGVHSCAVRAQVGRR